MTPLRWPVSDDPFTLKPIQWFDDYGSAVEMVNSSKRNLYIGEPVAAPRVEYTPSAEYAEWCAKIDAAEQLTQCLPDPLPRRKVA
jgi:hypothetical protein